MTAKRSKLEMYIDVVRACRAVRLTKLMYATNINCSILKDNILPLLIKQGLVEKVGKEYTRTGLGIEFIRNVRTALKMLGEIPR